jgi:hypothetical protein
MTSIPQPETCIVQARKIVAKTSSTTAFVQEHFDKGRPNNSQDSTTEGTISALGLLLKAYKKAYSVG